MKKRKIEELLKRQEMTQELVGDDDFWDNDELKVTEEQYVQGVQIVSRVQDQNQYNNNQSYGLQSQNQVQTQGFTIDSNNNSTTHFNYQVNIYFLINQFEYILYSFLFLFIYVIMRSISWK